MNGWKTWALGIFAGLVILGVGGALGLGFDLSGDLARAEEQIEHNAEGVDENHREVDDNRRKVDRVSTEWEWFKDEYQRDRKANREAHEAILGKLEQIAR